MSDILNIGSRRELFWDDTLIDTHQTTSSFLLHHPERKPPCFLRDKPWEGNGQYDCLLFDGEKNRLYYEGGEGICVIESADGVRWERPDVGIFEFQGSKHNNIVWRSEDEGHDGFCVILDPRPECPPEEKYKALVRYFHGGLNGEFWIYTSTDGYRFKRGWLAVSQGAYGDSNNTISWDPEKKLFRLFLRGFHRSRRPDDPIIYRDIRVAESEDCHTWTYPEELSYSTDTEFHMYINNIFNYPRAEQVLVGFPARLIARDRWTANYEELCGSERRRSLMPTFPEGTKFDGFRLALGVTETLFMTSRSARDWTRYEEAFLTPGPENPHNWVYGDVYLARGLVRSPGLYPGEDDCYSMYAFNKRFSGGYEDLERWTIRLDGFVSQHAGAREERLVTKPFVFAGEKMILNFATSARGHVKLLLRTLDGEEMAETCELFGNACDRRVTFTKGTHAKKDYLADGFNEEREECSIAPMSGRPVVLEMLMQEADVYAMKFE